MILIRFLRRYGFCCAVLAGIVVVSSLMTGCATLSQAECQNANWRAIGFEDGAKGSLPARIGQHREACAKYGIVPHLQQYRAGHHEGIWQFCTPRRGFLLGRKGDNYNGVCPRELETAFLDSYRAGKKLYQIRQTIRRVKSKRATYERALDHLHDEIARKEKALVKANKRGVRAALLGEIKSLQHRRAHLETDIISLEHQQVDLEAHYDRLNRRYSF